jgi:hypothetical protein
VTRICAYDDSLTNAVGSPYMLQEMVGKFTMITLECLIQALLQLPGSRLSNREVEYSKVWYDATIQSLGNVFGKIMLLTFDGYRSLRCGNVGQSTYPGSTHRTNYIPPSPLTTRCHRALASGHAACSSSCHNCPRSTMARECEGSSAL